MIWQEGMGIEFNWDSLSLWTQIIGIITSFLAVVKACVMFSSNNNKHMSLVKHAAFSIICLIPRLTVWCLLIAYYTVLPGFLIILVELIIFMAMTGWFCREKGDFLKLLTNFNMPIFASLKPNDNLGMLSLAFFTMSGLAVIPAYYGHQLVTLKENPKFHENNLYILMACGVLIAALYPLETWLHRQAKRSQENQSHEEEEEDINAESQQPRGALDTVLQYTMDDQDNDSDYSDRSV